MSFGRRASRSGRSRPSPASITRRTGCAGRAQSTATATTDEQDQRAAHGRRVRLGQVASAGRRRGSSGRSCWRGELADDHGPSMNDISERGHRRRPRAGVTLRDDVDGAARRERVRKQPPRVRLHRAPSSASTTRSIGMPREPLPAASRRATAPSRAGAASAHAILGAVEVAARPRRRLDGARASRADGDQASCPSGRASSPDRAVPPRRCAPSSSMSPSTSDASRARRRPATRIAARTEPRVGVVAVVDQRQRAVRGASRLAAAAARPRAPRARGERVRTASRPGQRRPRAQLQTLWQRRARQSDAVAPPAGV